MRQGYIVATLLIIAISSIAASVQADELDDQTTPITEVGPPSPTYMPPRPLEPQDSHRRDQTMAFGDDMFIPPHGVPHPTDRAWELASKLSAMETLIGVRTAQLDAWRDYTDALFNFLAFPARQPLSPPSVNGSFEQTPDRNSDKPTGLFGERIAAGFLDRGVKAAALKDKAASLRKVLSSDQLARLESAEQFLVPSPPEFR
ncbi:hypothetical protein [Oryzifoliimicrobium ureilyticus]|uniref:hypothetical protein n=1 Tax=Oryzifoliimicrobium ureilyticus TaxID=3113724 RepID=UPI0030760F8A